MELVLSPKEMQWMAKLLVQEKVLEVRPERPFMLRNGKQAPIKLHFEKAFQSRELRAFIMEQLIGHMPKIIGRAYDLRVYDVAFVGVPQGGVVWAQALAKHFGTGFINSEKLPIAAGPQYKLSLLGCTQRTFAIVEDTVNEGESAARLVKQLRLLPRTARLVISLFDYGTAEAATRFEELQTPHVSLLDWQPLREAMESRYAQEVLVEVDSWRKDPSTWGRRNRLAPNFEREMWHR